MVILDDVAIGMQCQERGEMVERSGGKSWGWLQNE